ncbi:hypothetical protein FPQ10_06405 [Allobacillus sp. SKP2-8]|uniref:hypothetical protein n=1 Tax=unclassified Allobacillus TaxID=2628859 RepID=UPI00118238E9|nr:hypothetical protein [Allobacillus sp. SKP2-8]TSJ66887.1 hypothetical protein FPQ10_06405 [Allobacillus sp. SKP2-8]
MKKKILITMLIVFVAVAWFINDQSKYTTYESAISELSIDRKGIVEVEIDDKRNHKLVHSNSQEVIQSIIEKPKKMELKETDKTPSIDYLITIRTSTSTYSAANGSYYTIALGKEFVHLPDAAYKVVGENKLYDIIENTDFNWESKHPGH